MVIMPLSKKANRKECTNYRGISLLSLAGKVYGKCLEKTCREKTPPSCRISSAIFVLGVSPQTKLSLSSKFSTDLGSIPKMSALVLSISRKHTV